jgi:hypothetical protein
MKSLSFVIDKCEETEEKVFDKLRRDGENSSVVKELQNIQTEI